MCKYCKRLKELNALDKKEYQQIINDWKRRDVEARALVSALFGLLVSDGADVLFVASRVRSFLECNYVGK